MNLDGTGADPELVRDRLVLLAADEEVHDLMLASAQLRKTRLGLCGLGPRLLLLPAEFEGAVDSREKFLLGKRLLDEVHCPGPHRTHSQRDIAISGNDDNCVIIRDKYGRLTSLLVVRCH
jgi:hypothetical protein